MDGEQQAQEAGGGVAPVALQPGVIDILEEGGTVDHHLRGQDRKFRCCPAQGQNIKKEGNIQNKSV